MGIFYMVQDAQNGKQEQMIALIEKFQPFISKYAWKLNIEDGQSEMTLAFIEIIMAFKLNDLYNTSDGGLVKYMEKALYHAYTKILKLLIVQNQWTTSLEELTPKQLNYVSNLQSAALHKRVLNIPPKLLTKRETYILRSIYEQEYSSAETARALHVSRQSVNQTKKNAEKKLKNYFAQTIHEISL